MPVRSRRRSARAVIVTGLSITLLALLGMAIAVETVKPEWRDPEYGHRLKQVRQLRAAHPWRPLVIAVGSSRTQMALSPAAMGLPDEPGSPLVYNFGQAGAGPLQMLLTVLRLLDAGVKPDFLLIEFFPAALVADGPAEGQFAQLVPRLSRADLRRLEPYCDDPASLRRAWAANRSGSWYSNRITLMSHWQGGWLPWQQRVSFQWEQMDGFGFTPYPHEAVADADRDRHYATQYAAALGDLHVGGTSDRALRDLLGRCRAEGIPVAFYLTPESPRFRGWYSPTTLATLAEYRATLGVPVFDATDGFAEEEFADGHHMLRAGAARFSRRLAAEHVVRWVRNCP
jgi:hypothetical protein